MNQAFIRDPEKGCWLHFARPRAVLQTVHLSDVVALLEEADRLVRNDGLYAAGWISYEAAPAFDRALLTRRPTSLPLVCFGIFDPPSVLPSLPASTEPTATAPSWTPSVTRQEYDSAIASIREHLAAGDTYQVNYTLRLTSALQGDPWAFFLRTCSDAPYSAYLESEPYAICSASPELFFTLKGERIGSKPMKGTAARGRTLAEDGANARWLYESEKNRAENVMIVDMIRNDLGRLACPGSVIVPRLYEIEKYPTVWQMTSTVEARTAADFPEILRALFPCASITGAPKVKTMEIIASLETTPRSIYTGAIGFFGPGRLARFNVAIRTTLIDTQKGWAEYGVGGGIVWDSTAREEYEECLDKARIVLNPLPFRPFQLLETLLWTRDEGYFLQERHLERLRASALYFDYPYDEQRIRKALAEAVHRLSAGSYRVRLLLAKEGTVECSAVLLDPPSKVPLKLRLAREPVDSRDPFLFHKTTRRDLYERAKAAFPKADDILLYNEAGKITESCIANVVVLRRGRLVTPPLHCGLLDGVFRRELLERDEISEEVVDFTTLEEAEKIFLINSVRKWWEAILDPKDLCRSFPCSAG